jgi:4-hydroxy-2-oxoheptanedioate aldolase
MARSIGSLLHGTVAQRTWWLLAIVLLVVVTVAVPPVKAQNRLNHMISVLQSGGVAVGTIISALTPLSTIEALRVLPLDWVFIDMEHGPFEPRTLRDIVLAFRAADGTFPITPIVRVAANCSEIQYNQWQVKQVLDVGAAFGILLAHCDMREWTEEGVIAMRYPPFNNDDSPRPRGLRGFGPVGAGIWGLTTAQYVQVADVWPLDPNGELLFIPMIESRGAINRLESILKVPGVGAAFIGPADLHADMGFAGQSGVPEVEAQIQRALGIAQRLGIPIAITTTAADVQARIDQGFRIVTIGGSPSALADILRALGR